VDATAERIAALVDELLGKYSDRQAGTFVEPQTVSAGPENSQETEKAVACSCSSGIPIQNVQIGGQEVTLIALPLIFEQFRQSGKTPSVATAGELLDTVKLYNSVPENTDEQYKTILLREYAAFYEKESDQ